MLLFFMSSDRIEFLEEQRKVFLDFDCFVVDAYDFKVGLEYFSSILI